jgi:hypothetical protein
LSPLSFGGDAGTVEKVAAERQASAAVTVDNRRAWGKSPANPRHAANSIKIHEHLTPLLVSEPLAFEAKLRWIVALSRLCHRRTARAGGVPF